MPGSLDRLIKAACKPYHSAEQLPPFLAAVGIPGRLVDPKLSPWTDPDTGLTVGGLLDECLEVPGLGFAPLDHKTRGSKAQGTNPAYQLQLDVYTLLLQGNQRPLLGKGYLVYYIPQGGWNPAEGLRFAIDVQTVDTDPERALVLVREAQRVLGRPEPPPTSPTCPYCAWAQGLWKPRAEEAKNTEEG